MMIHVTQKLKTNICITLLLLCIVTLSLDISFVEAAKPNSTSQASVRYDTLSNGPSIKLNHKNYGLIKGKSFRLKVQNLPSNFTVSYSSSNPKVANVTSKGKVTGKKNGEATITATLKVNNAVYRNLICNVEVGPPAVSIVISKSKVNLQVGERKHIRISVKPSNTVEVPVYKSSNSKVASITKAGLITAKAPGKTKITASIANGKKAVCTITVKKKTNSSVKPSNTPLAVYIN